MNLTAVPSLAGQTDYDIGSTKYNANQLGREVENTEIGTSHSGCIGKPTTKAKDAIASSSSSLSSWK